MAGLTNLARNSLKIICAIVTQRAGGATCLVQMVHMGQGLDQGQPVFAAPDRPFEQGRKTLTGAARFREIFFQPFQRTVMVLDHLA